MNYLKSEHLKFKRTILNKLIFMIPLLTALFAWVVGGFTGFQYMTFYWWYAFLLPGTIAILCSLSHRKEENAGKYDSIFSMAVNLYKFEAAKIAILLEKLMMAAIFLSMLISIGNMIAPATAVYSVIQNITGSLGIIFASAWQIPLCLHLARKIGVFLPTMLNTILGIFLPIVFGDTEVWYFIPYCWAAKLAQPLMGIEINGTFAGNISFSAAVIISIVLSVFLFAILTLIDTQDFARRGEK